MRMLVALIACLVLTNLVGTAAAQTHDIAGQWQTRITPGGPRMVLVIRKESAGGYAGESYLIDNSAHPKVLTAPEFKDGVFTFMDGVRRYRGVLSSDGNLIKGIPFNFERAPATGAWDLPKQVAHTVQTVTVDDGVKLEVVDWGGSGPPLIFLAGMGEDAHVFDLFAPRFTAKHHVYGISRRGFGGSDKPDPDKASYTAQRLADDVLHVIAALKLDKPALAGWSLGGSELSSIGTRAPEKVAGLVYLDSYSYAFYAPGMTVRTDVNLIVDANDLRDRIRRLLTPGVTPAETVAMLDELIATNLPELEADLKAARSYYQSLPSSTASPAPARALSLDERIDRAITEGEQKFTGVKLPVLALFALALSPDASVPTDRRERMLHQAAAQDTYIRTFEAAHPQGRFIRFANAQHALFNSHPEDVFREMDAFLDGLVQ